MKTRSHVLLDNDKALSWALALLAACLFVSPWVLGYRGQTAAQWNAWLIGFFLAYTAFAELFELLVWQEWVATAMGAWLLLAPWILKFSGHYGPTAIQSIVGVLVVLISGLELWHARHPPGQPTP